MTNRCSSQAHVLEKPMTTIEATLPAPTNPQVAKCDLTFRRILVAIDFSAQTQRVMTAAIQLATEFRSKLFLVHAATPAIHGTGAEPIPIETFEVNLEMAQARMTDLIQSHPRLGSLAHQEMVRYAGALDLIQQVIRDEEIDMVIAGSHGASGMERLALGSRGRVHSPRRQLPSSCDRPRI